MRYRWVGNYPRDFDGVMKGQGEFIDLDDTEPYQESIDNGELIEAPEAGPQQQRAQVPQASEGGE